MTRGRPTNAVMTEDHRPKDASASSSSEVCNGGEQDSQDHQQEHQQQEQFGDMNREWHDGGKRGMSIIITNSPGTSRKAFRGNRRLP
jgi:hypothetical protein